MKFFYSIFISILFFSSGILFSQEINQLKAEIQTNKPKNWDTTCYVSYVDKLNIYVGYSIINYKLSIHSNFKHTYKYPTDIDYTTNTPVNYSFGFSYDKISLSIGLGRKYNMDSTLSKPQSEYKSFFFSFGGNKFIIEPYLVRFKGFYDESTPKHDSMFKYHKRYFTDPSMEAISFKINGVYFFNHQRFAYRSLSGFTYRQLKTRGTWLLVANMYLTRLKSDSIIYPPTVIMAYDSIKRLNGFVSSGFGVGGGYGLILAPGKKKRFFVGATFAILLGGQMRQLFFKDSITVNDNSLNYGIDFRLAVGWTTNRFFLTAYSSGDLVSHTFQKVTYNYYIVPVNFNMGFRFNVKPPKFYQRFMKTRLYNWL
jgi:hypothetical protein